MASIAETETSGTRVLGSGHASTTRNNNLAVFSKLLNSERTAQTGTKIVKDKYLEGLLYAVGQPDRKVKEVCSYRLHKLKKNNRVISKMVTFSTHTPTSQEH